MSSGFISEAEIEEKKRLRQEEWEKVRKPDDPADAPEEVYDPRSLFDRLQEQKTKKDMEYEEAHKLKNMIKGLDDDEVDFLDLVDRSKLEAERRKVAEEEDEMRDFRSKVASLQERSLQERINAEVKRQPALSGASSSSRSSQQKLLAAVVKRKPSAEAAGAAKKSGEGSVSTASSTSSKATVTGAVLVNGSEPHGEKRKRTEEEDQEQAAGGGGSVLRCIGVLPGIGNYQDSSDSEHSSNTDDELDCGASGYDLCGRKIKSNKLKANN